jgi:hypothetical protein
MGLFVADGKPCLGQTAMKLSKFVSTVRCACLCLCLCVHTCLCLCLCLCVTVSLPLCFYC